MDMQFVCLGVWMLHNRYYCIDDCYVVASRLQAFPSVPLGPVPAIDEAAEEPGAPTLASLIFPHVDIPPTPTKEPCPEDLQVRLLTASVQGGTTVLVICVCDLSALGFAG